MGPPDLLLDALFFVGLGSGVPLGLLLLSNGLVIELLQVLLHVHGLLGLVQGL